jgi:hypothetical protein
MDDSSLRFGDFGDCSMHFVRLLQGRYVSQRDHANAARLLIDYEDPSNLMHLHQLLAGVHALFCPATY